MAKGLVAVNFKQYLIKKRILNNNNNNNRMLPLSFSQNAWCNPLLGDNLLQVQSLTFVCLFLLSFLLYCHFMHAHKFLQLMQRVISWLLDTLSFYYCLVLFLLKGIQALNHLSCPYLVLYIVAQSILLAKVPNHTLLPLLLLSPWQTLASISSLDLSTSCLLILITVRLSLLTQTITCSTPNHPFLLPRLKKNHLPL